MHLISMSCEEAVTSKRSLVYCALRANSQQVSGDDRHRWILDIGIFQYGCGINRSAGRMAGRDDRVLRNDACPCRNEFDPNLIAVIRSRRGTCQYAIVALQLGFNLLYRRFLYFEES